MLRQLLTLFAVLGCFEISAQGIYGIGYSSFGGVQNLDVTPVSIGSVYKADVNLFAFSYQQHMTGAEFVPLVPFLDAPRRGLNEIPRQFNFDSRTLGALASFDEVLSVAGPSFFYSPGKMGGAKRAFGLVTGMHSLLQVRNISMDALAWDFSIPNVAGGFLMNDAAVRRAVWAEYGLNYSQTVWNSKKHELGLGATVKFYQGMSAFVAGFDQLTVGFNNGDASGISTVNMQANNGFIFHSEGEVMSQENQGLNFSANGLSVGGDIGFTYSFKPSYADAIYPMDDSVYTDQSTLNYLLRFGVAVKNLGSLNFNNTPLETGTLPSTFSSMNYSFADSQTRFADTAHWAFDDGLQSDRWIEGSSIPTGIGESTFRVGLPTTLNVFADANLYKGLGASLQASIPVTNPSDASILARPAVVQFIPKFETAKRGVYLPLTVNEWSQFSFGVAMRFGSFSVALSNIAFLNLSAAYTNTAISLGLRVPLLHKRHEDIDNDKVSSLLDDCPTQPGPMTAKGCPDADFDGIRDDEDRCPQKAGLAERQGCPDKDNDGIIDEEDGCPAHFGPEVGTVKKGCPDADGDGFVDDDVTDKCPDRAGHVNGCPDSDEDGVMDDVDLCKDSKGDSLHFGCPDTDKDGVYDYEDECKEESGQQENGGCPLYDYDDDGVLDYKDRCQTIFGDKANDGCPLDEKIEITITEAVIYFMDGDQLTQQALAELKEVAKDLMFELQADADIKIELFGHAGLTEISEDKQALSLRRAQAVKAFLVSETGLPEVSFYPQGFADREGVTVKTYPSGKFPDRRVEIVLSIPEDK
jgi:outer membrane protein OmpA-like peptidoglycan-associated protein